MNCKVCSAPATVHIQEVVEGEQTTINLCPDCAQRIGITPDNLTPGNVAEFLARIAQLAPDETPEPDWPERTCARCGSDSKAVQTTGRLGCVTCYEVFSDVLMNTVAGLHRGDLHTGKQPLGSNDSEPVPAVHANVARESMRRSMKKRLDEAVANEKYELAQHLHDELEQMEPDDAD